MPLISVIIPVASSKSYLDRIRQSLADVTIPIEVLIVISKNLKGEILEKYTFEKIVVADSKGRGSACSQGIRLAKGEIIIFLHADTILPEDWIKLVSGALDKKNIVGGAFSLAFDTNHKYLKLLIFLSDVFFKVTGELWGDRAIFIRSRILKDQAQLMDVPIMEDVKLSGLMRKNGRVVMLKEKVITSSGTFTKHGLLRHTFRILKCRLWYALGGDLEKIYGYYYT